jgi:hypothetical protein
MIRTYSGLPSLLKQMADDNRLTGSEVVNKLIVHALSKKGYIEGSLEKKKHFIWEGNIEDMPLDT